jgi:hypothetical protein
MDFRRTFEMSISREEFLRLLPAAVTTFDVDGGVVTWSDGGCRRTIHLRPLADHRLGSVVVPRHQVEIVLESCPDGEGAAFLGRFHRAFLRGGG